ncbi:TM2 domain-containing protein [Bacillus sp. C1-1]|nr:TM2 domain-containing protein [Bacillus sp. C1-1]
MENELLRQDLSSEEQALVNRIMQKHQKNKVITYILWLFTGFVGGHRYYMGDTRYAVGMTVTLGGFGAWWIIDLLIIEKRLNFLKDVLEYQVIDQVLMYRRDYYNQPYSNFHFNYDPRYHHQYPATHGHHRQHNHPDDRYYR